MLYQAGPYNVLRTIAIIILAYYVFRWIFRRVIPWLLKNFVRKQFEKQQGYSRGQREQRREGEVHIKTKGKSRRNDPKNLGEYVDYEEIEGDPES